MRTRRELLRTALVIGLLAVVTAACTGGDSKSATRRSQSPKTTTTTAAPVVNCGNPVASYAPNAPLPPPGNMPTGSYMAEIQQRGRLIAGVAADNLLFGYRNPVSGNLEGFDIDMVRQVAQAIFGDPNRVQYKVLTYAQRIPALQSGAVDIVADVMTVNCERWQQIAFSSQYFEAGQKVLVRTDSTATGIADLNGKTMCAANGSTNLDNLKNYPKIKVVPVDDISDCMVLFQQGKVDSVTGDDTVLDGFVAQDPYAKIIGAPLTSEPYGLGVSLKHPEFVQFVNRVLEQMRTDGTWKQMYSHWLKPTGPVPDPPPAVYGRTP